MKKLTPYQKRKRAGQENWAKFQKYRVHYHHLEGLFLGFTIAGVWLVIMGLARGYQTPLDIIGAYVLITLTGVALNLREYFKIKASWRYWVLRIQNN